MSMAGGRPPISQADRDQVATLHAAGHGRNEIARRTGVGAGTVTKIIHELGGSFDRDPGVIAGTAAQQVDLKARRLALQSRIIARAEAIMDRLEAPTFQTVLRGEGGAENARTLDFVPARDEKDLLWAVGSCMTVDERIEKGQGMAGDQVASSMLVTLFKDVQGAWEQARAEQDALDMDEVRVP